MKGSLQDMKVTKETQEARVRVAEWGEWTVVLGEVHAELDRTPLFQGLPENRCQCPHWGYVIKGTITYKYADHDEVYAAGDAFYAPPGHTIIYGAGSAYVEFSPAEQLKVTLEHIARHIQAASLTKDAV